MSTDAAHHYEHSDAAMRAMKEAAPDIGRGFGAMYQKLMQEGALSMREKELIAVAIGMALRCDACIYSHVKTALKHGATREQLLEMAGVVVTMQGGPAYVSVPKLVDALDALGVDALSGCERLGIVTDEVVPAEFGQRRPFSNTQPYGACAGAPSIVTGTAGVA